MGLRSRLAVQSEYDNSYDDKIWTNKEQEPIPLGSPERTWTWPSLLGFWVAEAFSISMYQGENPRISWLDCFVLSFCSFLDFSQQRSEPRPGNPRCLYRSSLSMRSGNA